jgi:hypothetical protein
MQAVSYSFISFHLPPFGRLFPKNTFILSSTEKSNCPLQFIEHFISIPSSSSVNICAEWTSDILLVSATERKHVCTQPSFILCHNLSFFYSYVVSDSISITQCTQSQSHKTRHNIGSKTRLKTT